MASFCLRCGVSINRRVLRGGAFSSRTGGKGREFSRGGLGSMASFCLRCGVSVNRRILRGGTFSSRTGRGTPGD